MKIIISEEQLKIITESEITSKPMSIPIEEFEYMEFGISKILKIYNLAKSKKGFDGIRINGDLNLLDLDAENVDDIKDFCKEVVLIDGTLMIPSGNFGLSFNKLKRIKKGAGIRNMDNDFYFPKLEYVGNSFHIITYVGHDRLISLPKLKYVGDLYLANCNIDGLTELEYVGGDLSLRSTNIVELPKLKVVNGSLNLMGTEMSDNTTEEELRNKIDVKGNIIL